MGQPGGLGHKIQGGSDGAWEAETKTEAQTERLTKGRRGRKNEGSRGRACVLWGRKAGRLGLSSRFPELLASVVWTPWPVSAPGAPELEGPWDPRTWGQDR